MTDNRAIGPQDFDIYTFTALGPASSGQWTAGILLPEEQSTAFGAVDNYLTLASNYGDMTGIGRA